MLDSNGFNLWAEDYDKAVGISDESNEYPFAGYRALMNAIYGTIMTKCPVKVLDIGIGTGTLASKLHTSGNDITGIDFSDEMLKVAKSKMPNANLMKHDFTQGLPETLANTKFDFIVSTYALHHLPDNQKIDFIISLFDYLKTDGTIIIGDVSFKTRNDLEKCKNFSGSDWDEDEFYFVFSEINDKLCDKCKISYHQFSHCSGVMEIHPK